MVWPCPTWVGARKAHRAKKPCGIGLAHGPFF